jgi:hemerythrin-like domain-containing protein
VSDAVGTPFGAAAADFDDPFAILEACHQRIARMLRILDRLPAHLAVSGIDAEAREAIARVCDYFERAAPDHHADEEDDLFPAARAAARAAGDTAQLAAIDALERDHAGMSQAWAALRGHLDALVARGGPLDAALAGRFTAAYREHIEREEAVVFAAARSYLDAAARARLANSMVARRRR